MADTNQQISELLGKLVEFRKTIDDNAKGVKDLDAAINQLGAAGSAEVKLVNLRKAQEELTKSNNLLKTSLGESFNLAPLEQYRNLLKEIKAEYQGMTKAVTSVTPTPRQPLPITSTKPTAEEEAQRASEQRFLLNAKRQSVINNPELSPDQRDIYAQELLKDAQSKGIGKFSTYNQMVQAQEKKLASKNAEENAKWDAEKSAEDKILKAKEKAALAEERRAARAEKLALEQGLKAVEKQRKDTIAEDTKTGQKANEETKHLFQQELDAENAVVKQTDEIAKLQTEKATELKKSTEAYRKEAYNTALNEAKGLNAQINGAHGEAIVEDKSRTKALNAEYEAANKETLRLFQEELDAEAKVVQQTNEIATLQAQQAKVNQEILDKKRQQAFDNAKADAALVNAEINAAHGDALKEDRSRGIAKAQAEAAAAQQRLQGAGTQSAFSSVLGGTNTAELEKFNSLLSKYGITAQHVTGISKDLSTGVSQISFSMTDANGVIQQGSIHVDRFGRILQETGGKFQNLGDRIAGNITKVLQWAISLGIVYGGIQKVTELVQSMQRLQTQMVDIGITTGQTGTQLNAMLDSVRQIADATASDFGSGVESLATALRATSGIADQGQRSAQALTLLKDAMTLAKLAGIEHAQAMDYLVAGLKQMDMALTEGSVLLDKFQAISQSSNTSIEDLAATFAITAGAAQDVGVSVDQLTGLIGAFSEATTLSATETGNALRAMFSNFTQPQGIETLNKYGIAVKNVDGTFRSFIDVFKQASELSRSGILNERQVAELANALGGGSRRQAQVTALLTVQPRSEELANISQYDSAGKAQEALKQRTETLQSAMEKLQNAFDGLAKSLGSEGGFLGILTTGVNALTGILNIVNDITKALGPATAAIITYGLGWAALKSYGPNIKEALSGINGSLGLTANLTKTGIGGGYGVSGGLIGPSQDPVSFGSAAGKAFAPVAFMAIAQGLEALKTGDWSKTAGTVIGGGFVALISGNPVWAMIGATVGTVIAEAVQRAAVYASDYINAKTSSVPNIKPGASQEELIKLSQTAAEQFLNISKKGVFQTENFGQGFEKTSSNLNTLLGTQGYGTADQQLLKAVQSFREKGTTEGNYNFGFSDSDIKRADELLKLYEQIQKILDDIKNNKVSENDPAYKGIASIKSLTKESDLTFERDQKFKLIEDLRTGAVSKSDYKDRIGDAIPNSTLNASQALIALNPQLKSASEKEIKPLLKDLQDLKELYASISLEDRTFLNETVSNISQTRQKIEDLNKALLIVKATAGTGLFDPNKEAELNSQIASQNALLAEQTAQFNAIRDSATAAAKAKFKFSGYTDLTDYTKPQVEKLIGAARQEQISYSVQLGFDPNDVANAAQDAYIKTKEGYYIPLTKLNQEFLQDKIQQEKKAQQELQDIWNFQNLRNIDASQKGRLQQAINYYTQLLKKYGMNEKNELITVLFKDNQVGQLIGSQTALQLALQDLTEVTKKQLDGIYNLPSGATAYIPLSAGQMLSNNTANNASGSNIDYGNFPTPVLEQGNQYASRTAQGVEKLVTLTGQQFDPKAQMDRAKKGLDSGEYKTIYDALKAQSIFNTQIGPPAPETKKLPDNKVPDATGAQQLANVMLQLQRFVGGAANFLTSGKMPTDLMKPPTAGIASSQINITPAKIEANYNTTTTIRLDGRLIWSAIKKYAFDDYARFTTSVGSNSRGRTNVL